MRKQYNPKVAKHRPMIVIILKACAVCGIKLISQLTILHFYIIKTHGLEKL